MSLGSSLSEEVDSMRDKLNYLKMEEVVQHLGLVYCKYIDSYHVKICSLLTLNSKKKIFLTSERPWKMKLTSC